MAATATLPTTAPATIPPTCDLQVGQLVGDCLISEKNDIFSTSDGEKVLIDGQDDEVGLVYGSAVKGTVYLNSENYNKAIVTPRDSLLGRADVNTALLRGSVIPVLMVHLV